MSPCQRSLKKLRADGWLVAITERWNPWSKTRQDLFGFIDLACLKGDTILAVQTTSDNGGNVSARIKKIASCQAASVWLESPSRLIVVHGWKRSGTRGKRKIWSCREVWVTREDLV